MMLRNMILSAVLFAGVGSASASDNSSGQANWLIGTWVLCEDPDQTPKDSMQFNADGTGLSIRPKGNIELLHRIVGDEVQILANANGYAIPIKLKASASFDRLLLHSEKTGSTSSYIRVDNPAVKDCSVK